MNMKHIYYILVAFALFTTSCAKEDLGESAIDTSTPILSETDVWIRSNYTTPFNMEVKYKWDKSEIANNKRLTPPYVERVQPFLDNMKKVWIDPYVKNAGSDFMKRNIPKLMVLIGSHNYESAGGIVLGQAEGGRKITIYDINYITFDFAGMSPGDKSTAVESIIRTFRTMHHEFGHILHQTIAYPVEFKKITTNYTSNWTNFSNYEANRLGFVTAYSMLNPDEDFVEMLSMMLTQDNASWNKFIDGIVAYDADYNEDKAATEKAKASIRAKEKFVADYMLQVWNTNLYTLQKDITDILKQMEILKK